MSASAGNQALHGGGPGASVPTEQAVADVSRLFYDGHYAQVVSSVDRFIATHPTSLETVAAMLMKAESQYRLDDSAAAVRIYQEALVQAGLARLRPVLVTVLATVGGLIPLFLTGGALWHPLTAVHIVGLLLATVLTLVMLPTLYYVFCAKLKFIK